MIYATKLTSGEVIISRRKDDNTFIAPRSVTLENHQLIMLPWPQFLEKPLNEVRIDPSDIYYSGEAEKQVAKQYDYLLYQEQDEE